jgi:hypothetical protein
MHKMCCQFVIKGAIESVMIFIINSLKRLFVTVNIVSEKKKCFFVAIIQFVWKLFQ